MTDDPTRERQDADEALPDVPAVEGHIMSEAEVDRMRIMSWWTSYSYREADQQR
jgi:hypothetical protein